MRKTVNLAGTGTAEDPRRPNLPENVSFTIVETLPDGRVVVEYDDPREGDAVRIAARLVVEDKLDTLPDEQVETVSTFFDDWSQPTGAQDAYPDGAIVNHNGRLWRSTTPANVWEPGVSGWHGYGIDPAEIQAWVQPTGGHDAYNAGEQVTHNGQTWQSTVDANTWEPGVYGWEVIE